MGSSLIQCLTFAQVKETEKEKERMGDIMCTSDPRTKRAPEPDV